MSDKLTVLFTGATGQQGGAVADILLNDGYDVRILTRNPEGPAAKAFAARGATVFKGDFDHPDSVQRAAEGADSAYLMGTPFEAGTDAETAHGKAAIDALATAGVGHIVYASVASADQATGIPHFESKYAVEQHLAASGVPYSIAAPVFFADNHISAWSLPALVDGQLAMALPADRQLQQIALPDIGAFGAALIERREAVFGKRFDIAGDELTGAEAAAEIARASGREIGYVEVPIEAVRGQSEDLALMFEWFDRFGYKADIAALRRDFPEVDWHSFGAWATRQDWAALSQKAA